MGQVSSQPPLRGVVLCGGRSARMGRDKSALRYGGLTQRARCVELLKPVCDEVYVSCREDQAQRHLAEGECLCEALIDPPNRQGPACALIAAHDRFPGSAWLALACDLPLAGEAAVRELVRRRNSSRAATVYAIGGEPEPLFAIWEPGALSALRREGYDSSPRKLLARSGCELVEPDRPEILLNANTGEDRERALKLLRSPESSAGYRPKA